MPKKLLLILILAPNLVLAQNSDTTYYAEKGGSIEISEKASATFYELHSGTEVKNKAIIQYNLDGSKRAKFTYKDGILHGSYETYHPNGSIFESGRLVSGVPMSMKRVYYDNGQLQSQSRYLVQDGTLHHEMMNIWDREGNKLISNGNGDYKEYNAEGQIVINGAFKNGAKVGKWTYFETPNQNHVEVYGLGGKLGRTTKEQPGNELILWPEVLPAYPGGQEAWNSHLKRNLNYPEEGRRGGYEGRVFLSFIVNKDGSINEIMVIKEPHKSLGDEAKRVLELSPNWIPAKVDGKAVRTQMAIQLSFRLK